MNKQKFNYEKEKYNIVHESCGFSETQQGYGRQLQELLSLDNGFHKAWRECLESNLSFIEIGLGAGEIVKFFDENKIEYAGIDISNHAVENLSNLNVYNMSCHDMSFKNNSYDVVQHLDGMEHVPEEWENDSLREAVRVASKYIFYANAMGDASLDGLVKSRGFSDGVHVNIKNEKQWFDFYNSNKNMGYNIKHKEIIHGTFFIILEKVNGLHN